MPYTAGTFALFTPGNPVVTGTTISSTWANNTLNDIATGMSSAVLKDGTQTLTANIPMSSFKFTGMGSGTATTNAVAYRQLGYELISSVTAGVTTMIEFTTGISSRFDRYKLDIVSLRPSTFSVATLLYVLFSTDAGATFANDGNYDSSQFRIGYDGSANVTGFVTLSASGFIVGRNVSLGGLAAELIFDFPGSTTLANKNAKWDSVCPEPINSNMQRLSGGGTYGNASAVNAIRIGFTTAAGAIGVNATISGGTVSLYGLKVT